MTPSTCTLYLIVTSDQTFFLIRARDYLAETICRMAWSKLEWQQMSFLVGETGTAWFHLCSKCWQSKQGRECLNCVGFLIFNLYLFIYLCIYLFVCLFINLFIYRFIDLLIDLFVCLFIYLFICLFTYLFIYWSID